MGIPSLQKPVQVLLLLFLLFGSAFYAKAFLVPLTIAGLLAMLLLPLSQKMEQKGLPKAIAVLLCLLLVVAVLAAVVGLLAWQIADLAKDAPAIETNLTRKLSQLRGFIDQTFGITRQQQKEMLNNGQPSGRLQTIITGLLAGVGGFLTNLILVFVYLFLFLYLHQHLKKFVLMLVPPLHRAHASNTLSEIRKVAQRYLGGMAVMIGCLWVLYGIGFTIVGVKSAIFFAILCGLLEIVPFVGNLTGTFFTVVTVFAQGGSGPMVLGVLLTYGLVQFIQTYLLEPLVVGAGVSINPLVTIAALVVGELVWGIPGMILAIPLVGMLKIVCDNVAPWQPLGFFLGSTEKKKRGRSQNTVAAG